MCLVKLVAAFPFDLPCALALTCVDDEALACTAPFTIGPLTVLQHVTVYIIYYILIVYL